MPTAIVNARVFDGEQVLDADTVVVDGAFIVAVGGPAPGMADVVDAGGGTLLPGLFDSHTHTTATLLGAALRFGVTTELEMSGPHTPGQRAAIAANDTVADVRSAGQGITPPGGHPFELFPPGFRPPGAGGDPSSAAARFASTPDEAVAAVEHRVAEGADYVKFMVDDGSVEGHPGIPMLDPPTLTAGVAAAHRHGMITVAHAMTHEATWMALDAGIDGLAHLFMDASPTTEIIDAIAASGAFVIPCVVLDSSMMGIVPEAFADDPRVRSRLTADAVPVLRSCFGHYPQGRLADVIDSVAALHRAGVDLLAGTDASFPRVELGGLAHGASVHHELQHLVAAGLTPTEALRCATATPARRLGVTDRGRIASGLRADLLLVDGDPTADIGDTLDLTTVWRRGVATSLAV